MLSDTMIAQRANKATQFNYVHDILSKWKAFRKKACTEPVHILKLEPTTTEVTSQQGSLCRQYD